MRWPGPRAPCRSGRARRCWRACSSRPMTTVWSSPPSTTRPPPAPPSPPRSPRRAARWSAAGCSPTSAAASRPSRSRCRSRAPGSSSPAGPLGSACRPCPSRTTRRLPQMPAATGTVNSEEFAHAVAQAVTAAGRDDMLPVLTGVRLEIDGSTISLLATDRFRLSHRELAWSPHTPDESVAALVPARVLGDTAKSLTAGTDVTIALAHGGAGEGIIGFEGQAAGGVRRTTTRLLDGEFPKVRSLFPRRAPDPRAGRQGRADRVGQAGLPRRRAQHRRAAGLRRRGAHPRRRLGRRGAGVGGDRGPDRRRRDHDRLQPAVPPRRPHRHRRGPSSSWRSPRRPSRLSSAGRDARVGPESSPTTSATC